MAAAHVARSRLEAVFAEGNHRVEALAQLAKLVEVERDVRAALGLLPLLMEERAGAPVLAAPTDRLRHLVNSEKAPEALGGTDDMPFSVPPDREAFVALKLVLAGAITEGEYMVALDDLYASPSPERPGTPRSALHALQRGGFGGGTKTLVVLASDSGVPLLPLARFQPQVEAFSRLPVEFATVRGALAFDCLHEDLLVAVLNPYNLVLQEEVRRVGKRAIFYLVAAAEYDATLSLLPTGGTP